MKFSIIITLVFSLLSSVTFSEHIIGGWNCELKHNGVVIINDTVHANAGEVVEIWASTYGVSGPAPTVGYFRWYLDDVLVPLENFGGGGDHSGRYELNQPGKWDFRIEGGGCYRHIVVVWDYEAIAETIDSGESLNSDFEEEIHRESDSAPSTVDVGPNPTSDMIKFESTSKLMHLNILNQAGVIVYSSSPGTNEAIVHLNHLARGLYFAEIISEHGERTMERILVMD